MSIAILPSSVVSPSEDVVARDIYGELVIVPLVAGIGDSDDELFTMADTAYAVWRELDGERDLDAVVRRLAAEYDAPVAQVEADVLALVGELASRGIVTVA